MRTAPGACVEPGADPEGETWVYPALVEADRTRPGTAEHLAALPGIAIVELDLTAALSVARATTWADAHTLHAAQPGPDRPDGAMIATTRPHTWKEQPVRILDVSP